jgi:perosamine synthetase
VAWIPFNRPQLVGSEHAYIDEALASGKLSGNGEFGQRCARALEERLDASAVLMTPSCTAALEMTGLLLDLQPGDEVIVPSFTFAATANSVALTGATPVFADIEPGSFCLDPASVEAAVTERTKAIMPVHLYGHPADMTGLAAVAERHGLAIFEDAAQAHGATFDGRPVGSFGEFGMFSLYPTKNMTSGEGGMVSCDGDVAHRIRLLRNQGMATQYANELVGLNNRMTDIHAAIGRVQLTKLPGWTEDRRRNAAFLDAHLENVVVPPVREGSTHVYHQYTIRVEGDRDGMVRALREEHRVGSGVYYPIPNHRLPSFDLDLDLPETERAAREVISLPVHPSLSTDDLERVVEAVNAVVKAGA